MNIDMIYTKKENIKIWLIPFNLDKLENTSEEIFQIKNLPKNYANKFLYSRAYMRLALSDFLSIDPLKVPLYAPPQKTPRLKKDFGYISLSHCDDLILLVWSDKNIGADIERKDRKVSKYLVMKRFFKKYEELYFSDTKSIDKNFMDIWVINESIIKYQKTSLFLGIKDWEINLQNNKSINLVNHQTLNTSTFEYGSWIIGMANINIKHLKNPAICMF